MSHEQLDHVEAETLRFLKKLKEAREAKSQWSKQTVYSNSRKHGALKRAALDLKMELTRITSPYSPNISEI
jgi:hypothetical protein